MAKLRASCDVYKGDFITRNWETIRRVRKPVIAAVAGFALGGGCELAMMCDFIIAADNAKFGQPEIKLGIIPGAGGTQRLPRAVGKSKAMDMVLTGRMMDAAEAERAGLVSRVVPPDKLMDEALAAAAAICAHQRAERDDGQGVRSTAPSRAPLSDGVMFERRLFHALFATDDQKEGMDAFLNKRKPADVQAARSSRAPGSAPPGAAPGTGSRRGCSGVSVSSITSRSMPMPQPPVGGMPYLERADEVGVVVHRLLVAGFLVGRLRLEARGLVLGVVQLGEAVGDLAAGDEELEALGDAPGRCRRRAPAATPRPGSR